MAKVKYYLCIDDTVRRHDEFDDTTMINGTFTVDTDLTGTLDNSDIKDEIINYIYGQADVVIPRWLTDNRFSNCIWKGGK